MKFRTASLLLFGALILPGLVASSGVAATPTASPDGCYLMPPPKLHIAASKDLIIGKTVRTANEVRYYGVYKEVSFVVEKINCDSQFVQIVLTAPPNTDLPGALRELQRVFAEDTVDIDLGQQGWDDLYSKGRLEFQRNQASVSYGLLREGVIEVLALTVDRMA